MTFRTQLFWAPIWGAMIGLFLFGMACAGTDKVIEDARGAVDRLGLALQAQRAVIIAVCSVPPLLPDERCDEAQQAFNAMQGAYAELVELIP